MSDIDDRLERYVAGDMSTDERIAFEDDVLADPELASGLYADVNLQSAIEDAARARRERDALSPPVPWWRRPLLRWLAPATAAAAVGAIVWLQSPDESGRGERFRGGQPAAVAVGPVGDLDAPPARFVWRNTAAAYRFELFDAASTSVFSSVTADTTIVVDTSLVPEAGYWVLTPLSDLHVGIGAPVVTSYQIKK